MRRCPQCGTEYPDDTFFCGHDGSVNIAVLPPGSPPDTRLGLRFGDYIVCAPVADGAMGRVYEGRHVDTKKKVAVKILHTEIAKDRIAVERFKREYETAKELDSKYVVRVIDFGETPDSSYFLTMEFLEGHELGNLLRAQGAMPTARVIRVLCQVALGLDDAHSFGVIHRDLKPDNLFLVSTPAGDEVRLLDFGSVKLQMETGPKLTAFGTTLGSPYYMSPEQAMGKADVDNRSDVLALAAITYEMICGKIAFEGKSVAEILMKIVNQMPTPLAQVKPGTPHAVDDALEKGLAKDKQQRTPNTVELAANVLRGFGLSATNDRGSIEGWAQRTVAEIESALSSSAAPPAATAPAQGFGPPAAGFGGAPAQGFGAPAPAAGFAPAPLPIPSQPPSGFAEPPAIVPANNTIWIVLAAGAVLMFLLTGAALGAYFLFG
jgi:serine/threonine-protein kinase